MISERQPGGKQRRTALLNSGRTSPFKKPRKDSQSSVLWARRKLRAISTNEYRRVSEANENPSLRVDLSSQESSPALPGVTSSLLVSIKDDELETEGEERLSTDAWRWGS